MCRKKVAGMGTAMNTLGKGVLENHLGLSPVYLNQFFLRILAVLCLTNAPGDSLESLGSLL